MSHAAANERRFTGWHMIAVMVLFFGTVIAVNLTLAYFAGASWTGLVVKNAYVAGQSFNEEQAKARAQAALGLKGELAATPDRIVFEFIDAEGNPVVAEAVTVRIGRPAYEAQDRTLALDYLGAGRYAAETALGHGVWKADLVATLGDGRMWRRNWRLTVRPEKGN